MPDISQYDLIIFDLDGTLAERDTNELLDGVAEYFNALGDKRPRFALATNQGGVGMRYWMESKGFGKPQKYPTEQDILTRLDEFFASIGFDGEERAFDVVNYAFSFEDRNRKWSPIPPENSDSPHWSRAFRKPNSGMLIDAMQKTGISSDKTLMVGDRSDDEGAAKKAGCDFMHADVFFNRTQE